MIMNQLEIENKLKVLKPILTDRFSVEKIGHFGSFSCNEMTEISDIDLFVKFHKPVGWEFFDLKEFIENELKMKVDLFSYCALRTLLSESILMQVQYV